MYVSVLCMNVEYILPFYLLNILKLLFSFASTMTICQRSCLTIAEPIATVTRTFIITSWLCAPWNIKSDLSGSDQMTIDKLNTPYLFLHWCLKLWLYVTKFPLIVWNASILRARAVSVELCSIWSRKAYIWHRMVGDSWNASSN